MPDLCEQGSERAQQMLDDALTEQRIKAARSPIDHLFCESCDRPIPLKRRELLPGVETCVDCQSIMEQQGVIRGR